jgi:hypothetical protein
MKRKMKGFIPVAALLCLSIVSCKKSEVPGSSSTAQTPTQQLLMRANNTITSASDQQAQEVSDILGSTAVMPTDSSACRVVTFSPSKNVYPHLKTVDFGSGCTGSDGITRSGKKLITVYANSKTAPAGTLVSETTFSDFWVDSVNVSGNVKIYIDTAASPGPLALKIITNKTFTDTKGNTSTFIATSYWLQIAGDTTSTTADNVFQITSSASGTEVLDGGTSLTWTSNTDPQHPVIKMSSCAFRSSGALQIQLTLVGGTVFNEYLDYGNGTCDNQATMTINNGTPQTVTLPLFFWPLSL